MFKRIFSVCVLALALTALAGCYGEEPYADKKNAQEEAQE